MKTRTLSAAQKIFLLRVHISGSCRTPFTGGRNAGRVAAAWYRTAESLRVRGLLNVVREGDAKRATLTEAGHAWARAARESANLPQEKS